MAGLLLAVLPAWCQSLTYDFSKGEFLPGNLTPKGSVKPLTLNGFSTIRIINVNTFRYKVEINGRSVNYVTPIPSELQTIFRLQDQQQTQRTTEDGVRAIQGSAGEVERLALSTTNAVQVSVANLQAAQRKLSIVSRMKFVIEKTINSKKAIKKAVTKKEKDSLATFSRQEEEHAEELDQLRKVVDEASPFDEAMKELRASVNRFLDVTKRVAAIKFRRIELINLSKNDWSTHQQLLDHLPAPLSKSQMQRDFQDFGSVYHEVLSDAAAAQALANDVQAVQVKAAKDQVQAGYDKITEDGLLKIIEDVVVLQQSLDDPATFSVVSPPIQIGGDVVAFTIKGTPVKANDLSRIIQERSFPVEIPSKGGLKVDFSVGPTVSFGKHSRDEKFFLEESSKADTVLLSQRDNNNSVSPGLAAMMHFYSRTGKELAFGGMLGVGAGFQSVGDPNFCLYGGVSLVMGKAQKIILSSGVSFLRVDRLKSQEFETGKEYATAKVSLGDVTEKVFRPSLFFSISYNITNRIDVK